MIKPDLLYIIEAELVQQQGDSNSFPIRPLCSLCNHTRRSVRVVLRHCYYEPDSNRTQLNICHSLDRPTLIVQVTIKPVYVKSEVIKYRRNAFRVQSVAVQCFVFRTSRLRICTGRSAVLTKVFDGLSYVHKHTLKLITVPTLLNPFSHSVTIIIPFS